MAVYTQQETDVILSMLDSSMEDMALALSMLVTFHKHISKGRMNDLYHALRIAEERRQENVRYKRITSSESMYHKSAISKLMTSYGLGKHNIKT